MRRQLALAGVAVWPTRSARRARPVAIGLGALVLALAAALPLALPVFGFPPLPGPCGIGTLVYQWTDRSRAEVFAAGPARRRQLMVQVWYPAPSGLAGPPAA